MKKVFPKIGPTVTMFVPYDCNNACPFCVNKKEYRDTSGFDLQRCYRSLDLLNRIFPHNDIVLTGGEPLIINNFSEITTYLQEHYNGSIALATNATLISEENVIQIVDTFDVIDISIDGINEEKCDAIRGEGTYRKVLTAIELLKRNDAKNISLSITLDNDSAGDREYFEAMCKKMEVEAVVRNMNLVGRAADNHKDSDQICDFMDVSTSNISQCYDCPGGVNEISVNYQGNIYPCNLFVEKDYEIGNILDENFTDKLRWDKKENWFNNFSEFIPDTRKECENCEVNSFCWDCPALAKTFLQNNDIDKLTDICGDKYKLILEEIWNE